MDKRHSTGLLTEEEFDQGLRWLSEGLCPCCGTLLERVTAHDGQQAGRCPALNRTAYRMEQDPVHGPSIVSTTIATLTLADSHRTPS